MNETLKVVLSMSFSGGIMILILLLVVSLFRNRLGRQWQYYIWLIAVIRLLIPFVPQNNLTDKIFHSAETAMNTRNAILSEKEQDGQGYHDSAALERDGSAKAPESDSGAQRADAETGTMGKSAESGIGSVGKSAESGIGSAGKNAESEIGSAPAKSAASETLRAFLDNIFPHLHLIWILPACILLARKVISCRKLLKQICAGNEEVKDAVLLEHLGRLLEKTHIRNTVTLAINSTVPSPMITGILKPCIILPSEEITASEFECTVLHELMHYRRKDILYKWLVQFTICLHWFNPCSYLLGRMVNKACELSCDEAVIRKLDTHERYIYGDVLLHTAGKHIKHRASISTVTFSNGKKDLKERLNAIMNFRKRTKASFVTAFALSAALLAGSAYIGTYTAGEKSALAKNAVQSETDAASKTQNTDAAVLKKAGKSGQKTDWKAEYKRLGIETKNNILYYKNKRVRLLNDTVNNRFWCGKKGVAYLKIVKGKDNTAVVKKIPRKEVKRIENNLGTHGTYTFTAKKQNGTYTFSANKHGGTLTFTAKKQNGKHSITIKKRKNGTYAFTAK